MAQNQVKELVDRASATSESWTSMPTILELLQYMGPDPLGVKVVITCAGARADPTHYLDLKPGEVPIIRVAGGRITPDVLTSLELLGSVVPIATLVIIHHTDCGGLYMTEQGVRDTLTKRAPEHASSIKDKNWYTYKAIGMDQSIRDDVAAIQAWPFVSKGMVVAGYEFDIKTGKFREVVPAKEAKSGL